MSSGGGASTEPGATGGDMEGAPLILLLTLYTGMRGVSGLA